MMRSGRFAPTYPPLAIGTFEPRFGRVPLAEYTDGWVRPQDTEGTSASSPAALEQASFLGLFALGVPCCAGALPGGRIRVMALEPVTALDLGVARMKLARWYPREAEVIELAAAGCWNGLVYEAGGAGTVVLERIRSTST